VVATPARPSLYRNATRRSDPPHLVVAGRGSVAVARTRLRGEVAYAQFLKSRLRVNRHSLPVQNATKSIRQARDHLGMYWLHWTIAECENAPLYHERIDRLRHLSAKALDGRPLTDFPLGQLADRFEEIRTQPRSERRGVREDVKDGPCWDEHVARYLTGVSKTALRFHGATALAPAVHRLVGASGYRLPLEAAMLAACSHPAPTGRVASALAAFRTGVLWGAGATAQRQLERRYRPASGFYLAAVDGDASSNFTALLGAS
jgi:hypothetical protein